MLHKLRDIFAFANKPSDLCAMQTVPRAMSIAQVPTDLDLDDDDEVASFESFRKRWRDAGDAEPIWLSGCLDFFTAGHPQSFLLEAIIQTKMSQCTRAFGRLFAHPGERTVADIPHDP